MNSQPSLAATVAYDEMGTLRSSSLELACGADVQEVSLSEVSNSQLEELLRMRQSWRKHPASPLEH